jgi:very-short-patch-repair endonuclease
VAPKAPGEGLVPQEPHHRPIARRVRNFAKRMRREPTDAEAAMWRLLRDRRFQRFKFRRQVPFQSYILDFVCFEQRLVIEIDGSQHASAAADVARDDALVREGFMVARYWNNDVLQRRDTVMEDILAKLSER